MKYQEKAIINIKNITMAEAAKENYRINKNDFTRERKMNFQNVVYYNLNKKGLTSKMEIEDFEKMVNMTDISSSAVLKQREKLNADIYSEIRNTNLQVFYNEYKDDVKLFKGYILSATDGSDFEIPNTKKTRIEFNSTKKNTSVARALISNSFDVLNHFVLSTVIGKQTDSEIKMDIENLKQIKALNLPFEIIRVKDRGYVSLKDIYYSNILNDKYVTRLTKSNFKKEILSMESNDEIIEIPYEKHRALYYKNSDPEFYEILKTKPSIFVRIVKIKLSTGEIETLITNLSKEEVTTEEMNELYNLRWQIELNYHLLKESLKIETITSSKEELIKQDIYSQMLVFNLLQIFVSEAEKEINQSQYKHKMKINNNMATGFLKKALIIMLIEEDPVKQNNIIAALVLKIKKYIVPIRDGRSYPRNKNRDKNRYSITKRKSF